MKNVLHISHTDISSDSRILKEIEALSAAGYSVSGLGVRMDEGAKESKVPFRASITSVNLFSRQLRFLPRTLRHALSLIELFLKIVPRGIRGRPDIVHCHDTLALPLGVVIKFICGSKLVYDAHELESDRNGISRLQGKLTILVENFLWRWVDSLIVVSPSICQWYLTNVGPKPVAVVLNAPVIERISTPENDYFRRRFRIPESSRIFVYVGILGPGRGIDLILDAFMHPENKAHVVFIGYGELADSLTEVARQHETIHVHEAVPHAQVVPLLRSADFGFCLIQNVSLSDYFCLPNKLFEYCFAGLSVLASNFPDIRTVVDQYGLGECCELNGQAVFEAVKKLQANPKSLITADLSELSWQAQGEKLLGLYKQLAR